MATGSPTSRAVLSRGCFDKKTLELGTRQSTPLASLHSPISLEDRLIALGIRLRFRRYPGVRVNKCRFSQLPLGIHWVVLVHSSHREYEI